MRGSFIQDAQTVGQVDAADRFGGKCEGMEFLGQNRGLKQVLIVVV